MKTPYHLHTTAIGWFKAKIAEYQPELAKVQAKMTGCTDEDARQQLDRSAYVYESLIRSCRLNIEHSEATINEFLLTTGGY